MIQTKFVTFSSRLLALCALLVHSSLASAAPFTPGNVLTFDLTRVREYTPQGGLVQEISVPIPSSGSRDMVDGVVDKNGRLHVFNRSTSGSFASTYDPITGLWTHDPMPEYPSVSGNISSGDVGIFGNYLYFGVVRIDLSTHAHNTFSTTVFGSSTASIGRNGLLYVAQAGNPAYQVAELDPITLAQRRVLSLRDSSNNRLDITGITAAKNGDLFAATLDSKIFHYTAGGTLLSVVDPPANSFFIDIDITDDGKIVTGSRDDSLMFTDTNLSAFTTFTISALDSPHVAFVQMPVPEPNSFLLAAIAGGILHAMRKRLAPSR